MWNLWWRDWRWLGCGLRLLLDDNVLLDRRFVVHLGRGFNVSHFKVEGSWRASIFLDLDNDIGIAFGDSPHFALVS